MLLKMKKLEMSRNEGLKEFQTDLNLEEIRTANHTLLDKLTYMLKHIL